MISQREVKNDLKLADWVSLKIDAVNQATYRRIDRPHPLLKLDDILEGIEVFSREFQGDLNIETMLVRDINDQEEELHKIARFISKLNVQKCYISIPTRPPTLKWVQPPEPEKVTMAYQIFKEYKLPVECLLGFAVDSFGSSGDIERDILSITSVHPMREPEVKTFIKEAGKGWGIIKKLINEKKLVQTEFGKQKFYVRNFSGKKED